MDLRVGVAASGKDWLLPGTIPSDTVLETDLTGPGYHLNRSGQLVIESKQDMVKRGVASPNSAHALCLTWAAHVPPIAAEQTLKDRLGGGMAGSWMG